MTARAEIRAARARQRRVLAVLDDDPTGSQAVHEVDLVTAPDVGALAAGLASPHGVCFALTNSRGLAAEAAARLDAEWTAIVAAVAAEAGWQADIVSRSDSTLRGHVIAEPAAIAAAWRDAGQRPFDAVVFAPGYFEAGRFTRHGRHHAMVDGRPIPVGETIFAADTTFGYRESDLRRFLAERSGGALVADDVALIDLDTIRDGGAAAVAERLLAVSDGRWVVVDGECYDDYETVALGVARAQEAGAALLFRSGPSFVRALAGIDPRPPLRGADIGGGDAADTAATTDAAAAAPRAAGGLVVVGSHVATTTAQVAAARAAHGDRLVGVDVEIAPLVDPARRDGYVAGRAAAVVAGLRHGDVLLCTSRSLVVGASGDESLQLSRTVSLAVADIVSAALDAAPRWIIAKGGITSHDVAVHGLGVRRGRVLGQLFDGIVSVVQPLDADRRAMATPYVVFAGNVGTERSLADAITIMNAAG